eukprot:Gb_32756 [translate_table: standard]
MCCCKPLGDLHRAVQIDGDWAIPGRKLWTLDSVERYVVLELSVEDLGEPVYAWELPGVAGNACNGLTPTVALQLAAVVYGANLFSEPLEDLNAAWLLECLRTLVEGLALPPQLGLSTSITKCHKFMVLHHRISFRIVQRPQFSTMGFPVIIDPHSPTKVAQGFAITHGLLYLYKCSN